MTLTNRQRTDRLRKRLTELELWTVRAALDLGNWTFEGEALAHGAAWPTQAGVVVFAHDEVEVPEDWPLEDTRLDLNLGGEGLLRLSYDNGGEAAFGLDPNHESFRLTGRRFSIRAECVARLPFGVPSRGAALIRARLAWVDPALAEFVLLLTQVAETAEELEQHEVTEPMLAATEAALTRLDWPTATQAYVARVAPGAEMQRIWQLPALLDAPPGLDDLQAAAVRAATYYLQERLRVLRERYPQNGALALTGHAHIDLAWLWPLDETRRKANRTFHTMLRLMERYPEFRFNQSTAQLYAFLEEDDPALFDLIREKAASGQWEPVGAMWVEPDTNMPTGESFVRQLLYGQRYFERVFGRTHTVCWLPDCFGFSPALPQILRGAGVDSFFTIKVNWSETNAMPFDLFWWEGLDGSRVLAHTFNNPVGGYNAETSPRAVLETWKNYRGKHLHPESLLAFGFGDGGGGPTEEMLERQRQLADFPVVPALRPVSIDDWYRAAHAAAKEAELPVWVGEIYLELHRGTLTTQSGTKYLHRRAERALVAAETLASMATLLGEPVAGSLEEQWRLILRNEFHDILPGSGIREVYDLAEAELGSVVAEGTRVAEDRMAAIAGRLAPGGGGQPAVLAVNPDLSPRPLRLASAGELPGGQAVEGGSVLAGARAVPGLTAAVVINAAPPPGLRAGERHLENADIRVEIGEDGTLASVYDKRHGREALADRGNQLWAYVDKPRNWDAWDIEEGYAAHGEEITAAEPPEVVETGPHRAALRIRRRYRDSEIVQTLRLWANSPRLDIVTDIDWHDRKILLKARFPLAIRSDHATFECAYGVIRRPTHRNTSWEQARFEVVAHRFADLSEQGYGVALLNDGKYGHHALGNELGLSLLRSPVYPDALADEGRQSFTYALLPHAGDWFSGGVLAEAEDLNQPMPCRPLQADSEVEWSAARVAGLRLGLSAFKAAEDGEALILRAYEPAGGRGAAEIALPEGWRLGEEVDLLERPAGRAGTDFRPFELRSWRVEKGG